MVSKKTTHVKNCKFCSVVFETTDSRVKHCSKNCLWSEANKNRRLKRIAEAPLKLCAFCRNTFKSHLEKKIYCSKKCVNKACVQRKVDRAVQHGFKESDIFSKRWEMLWRIAGPQLREIMLKVEDKCGMIV